MGEAAEVSSANSTASEPVEVNQGTEVHEQPSQPKPAPVPTPRELTAQDMDAIVSVNIDGQLQKMPLRQALKEMKEGKQAKSKWEKHRPAWEESQKAQQNAQQLFQLAKTNPRKFLELTGHDPYAFAESTLTERLQYLQMSPEARAAAEAEERFRRAEAEKQQLQQQIQHEQLSRETAAYADSVDRDLTAAFKESGLPKHKWYVQMAANEMAGALERGEELSAREAIAIVKEIVQEGHVPSLLQDMPIHQLVELLGEQRRKELREFELQSVQHQGAPQKLASTPAARKQPTSKKVFRTDEEYRQWVESLKG